MDVAMRRVERTDLSVRAERAVLVGVYRRGEDAASIDELERLASTAGARVVGKVVQKRAEMDSRYCVGRGKLREIKRVCTLNGADVVVFDLDLKPAQVRNLEEFLGVKVIDRTELILDIFATHASTQQARLQVELAQLEYTLPRLVGMWTHLSRVEGGIGMRGPGEQQLETDRRIARRRIQMLRRKLDEIKRRRSRQVGSREECVRVSLIGYTNAGKSTLMNLLTGSRFLVQDKLFATLDTRTRKWRLKSGFEVLLSDTVGFINNLPHHLVESFHATLEEVRTADVLLHVVDAAAPSPLSCIEAVDEVLAQIGCADKPQLVVFNKMDLCPDTVPCASYAVESRHPVVYVSAKEGKGLDEMEEVLESLLDRLLIRTRIVLPADDRDGVIGILTKRGMLLSVSSAGDDGSVVAEVRVPSSMLERLSRIEGLQVIY